MKSIVCVKFLARICDTGRSLTIAYFRSFPSRQIRPNRASIASREIFFSRRIIVFPRDPEILPLSPGNSGANRRRNASANLKIRLARRADEKEEVRGGENKKERKEERETEPGKSPGTIERSERQNRPELVASDERTEDPGVPCDCSRMRDAGRRISTGSDIVPWILRFRASADISR